MRSILKMTKIIAIILTSFLVQSACAVDQQDITILATYEGKAYMQMVKELGAPIDKTGYTIEKAPTKGWNHEIFSLYPKNRKNKDVQIMEVTWNSGDYQIMACYHMVDGINRCIVAKRIKKGIKF